MLVAVYGPSGVGKTEAMGLLRQDYGWRGVRTVSTRPPRHQDVRWHMSQRQFELLLRHGALAHANKLHDHYYASLAEDLIASRDSACVYVVDMSIMFPLPPEQWPHVPVVILPVDSWQLHSQLRGARRLERFAESNEEYLDRYSPRSIVNRLGRSALVVVNSGTIEDLASAIARGVCGGASERHIEHGIVDVRASA